MGLEPLEQRSLLATLLWTNAAGGDWDNAANWTVQGSSIHRLPGPADDVTINITPSVTITHNGGYADSIHSLSSASADSIGIAAGSLALGSASTISGALNLSGGTLGGTGDLTVGGLLTWTGGTMAGSGRTNANGGLAINGPYGKVLDGRTLNNGGAAAWAGTGYLGFYRGAVLNNQAGATFAD